MILWLLTAAFAADTDLERVIGWTDQAVVFAGTHRFSDWTGHPEEEDSELVEGSYPVTCVHELGGEQSRCFAADANGASAPDARFFGSPDELATWTQAHPMKAGAQSVTADGRTLGLDTTDTPTDRHEDGWKIVGEATALTATITRGGEVWAASLDAGHSSAMGRDRVVTPSWSPDHRHLALFFEEPGGWHMRGPIPPSVEVVFLDTTLVTVMAHGSVDARVSEQASGAIRAKAGLPFQRTQSAKKAREATVVYYADGYESQARAILEALPNGGSAEPLSWSSHSDLIVALGSAPGS